MGIAVLVLLCISVLAGRLGFESVRDVAGYQSGYWLIASILAGLVSFETLVYLGLRRLKYANPPGSEAELAPPEAEPPEAEPPEEEIPKPEPEQFHAQTGLEPGGGPVPDGGV